MDTAFIQVSGLNTFPQHRWREGILAFVNGILADEGRVTYRPMIAIGGACLRLDVAWKMYVVSIDGILNTEAAIPTFDEGAEIEARAHFMDTEHSLLRFVKNNKIRKLSIWMPMVNNNEGELGPEPRMGHLVLWKGRARSFLGVAWRPA